MYQVKVLSQHLEWLFTKWKQNTCLVVLAVYTLKDLSNNVSSTRTGPSVYAVFWWRCSKGDLCSPGQPPGTSPTGLLCPNQWGRRLRRQNVDRNGTGCVWTCKTTEAMCREVKNPVRLSSSWPLVVHKGTSPHTSVPLVVISGLYCIRRKSALRAEKLGYQVKKLSTTSWWGGNWRRFSHVDLS